MTEPFLPYGRQVIDDADVAAVARVLRGDYLTTGPTVAAFERALAAAIGAPHVAACANGTAALHLAALALNLGPGDTVIVPAVTFLATANAAVFVGADVVFADVDPDSGLMRPSDLEAAFARAAAAGRRVKAVFTVHLAGQCADLAATAAVAARHGVPIVEDACHALGTTWRDSRVGDGRYGALATFSFHPVKTIAAGEGGAVATRDEALYKRILRLRNHGMVREPAEFADRALGFDGGVANPWYYEMPEPGFNYRLSDIHAALALSQLGKLDTFVARRRALAAAYDRRLAALAPLVRPLGRAADCMPAWHLYVVLIDFAAAGRSRAQVMTALRRRGIGSQVHYLPLPLQPYYRARERGTIYPGAAAYYARCLSLPLYPAMTDPDVERVADALEEALSP
jgi:UDP-4-amino-4,6-dideoxy-N-acetyl-beta-L-altrosamine transaminase